MNIKQSVGQLKPIQARLTPANQQWLEERKRTEDRSANWVVNNVFDQVRGMSRQKS